MIRDLYKQIVDDSAPLQRRYSATTAECHCAHAAEDQAFHRHAAEAFLLAQAHVGLELCGHLGADAQRGQPAAADEDQQQQPNRHLAGGFRIVALPVGD